MKDREALADPMIDPVPAPSEDPAGDTQLPHVVAWNLTKRCNLACAHCYISAGSWQAAAGELTTDQCRRVLDEILSVNPSPMLILSGGEPLLRDDLETLTQHASSRGATVVVGTNGTRLTDDRIQSLKDSGLQGVAVSVDSLDARYHDRFRHGSGALADTLQAVDRLRHHELDFVVQTTLTKGNRKELSDLTRWAAEKGAVAFNLYFVVATGRGEKMPGLEPEENERVLAELLELEQQYRGRMMVRSKCQPQIMRHAAEKDPQSPLLSYGTRCPCGVHYCRITPEGKVTPCPYTQVVAGDLLQSSFGDIWFGSPVFSQLRKPELGGRCGRCEYQLVCGGCRARAHATTGDLLGPDDSCVYDPPGDLPLVEFASAVSYGQEMAPELQWTADARARLDAIPSFVRGVVTERVERFARERGHRTIDLDVMAEVRRSMPAGFSKRMPFFLRGRDAAESPDESDEKIDAGA